MLAGQLARIHYQGLQQRREQDSQNLPFHVKIWLAYKNLPEVAAKESNAHDFIMSFPDAYKTQVGAGSTQVSGGQKQRICISRCLLRKPKVRSSQL